MAVLVGIDEAGFGPILGPLVVSSVAFSLPNEMLRSDLWEILKKSTAKQKKKLLGRLLICDSKKAHTKSDNLKHLRRTTLALLQCLEKSPSNLAEFLEIVSPDSLERLAEYWWYQKISSHGLACDNSDIEIAAGVFNRDLKDNGLQFAGLKSRCLDVAYYNQMVSVVKNKSSVLFTETANLIQHAIDNFSDDQLQIVVDRQGGRVHYATVLQKMFTPDELTILKEIPSLSSYELVIGGKIMRIHFTIKADDRFFPVALASMASKYLRELLMQNINQYFIDIAPSIKPTAGYWTDGLRFLDDIKKHIPDLEVEKDRLVRSR